MAKKILITGASGLIGSRLTDLLLARGHEVAHLGRSKRGGKVPSFVWDVTRGTVDAAAFQGVDTIIHLAGAGIADRRWTPQRKEEIRDSRIASTRLLFQFLKNNSHTVKAVLSASAIGYYGFDEVDQILSEEDAAGTDFLAMVTRDWEREVDTLADLQLRVVKLRIGIVLSQGGGALPALCRTVQWGVGAALGTGRQMISWIHADDLCGMFIHALDDERMQGAYNAVTDWCTNAEMTRAIANVLRKPLWLPNVPSMVMQLLLGEMAALVLTGNRISSAKIRQTGFQPHFTALENTLQNLLRPS